jgi:hypothetical protein
MVELLSELLAQRTSSGEAHVVLSAADFDKVSDIALFECKHLDRRPYFSDLRQLRNRLVHQRVFVSVDNLGASVDDAIRLWRAVLEPERANRLDAIEQLRALATAAEPEIDSATLETTRVLVNGFLERLLEDPRLVAKLEPDEARRLGSAAAGDILAAARWSQVVGDRIDTTAATQLLGVTRQALAKRQAAGSILGIPGNGTTWYPTWQFDPVSGEIRPEVRDIIGAFRERLDDFDPLTVAAWAKAPQDEDLDGQSPEQWIRLGLDRPRLRTAAERAAARLA